MPPPRTVTKHRSSKEKGEPTEPVTRAEGALKTLLGAYAASEIIASARLKPPRGLLSTLTKQIGNLLRLKPDEQLPATTWLCDNGRFLQEEAAAIVATARNTAKLPASERGVPRVIALARIVIQQTGADFTLPVMRNAIAAWQAEEALNESELNVLPLALRIALMEAILQALEKAVSSQTAFHQALVCYQYQNVKPKQSEAIKQRYLDSPTFVERLFSLMRESEDHEAVNRFHALMADRGIEPAALAAKEHAQQTQQSAELGNAITSLRLVSRMTWQPILEQMSLLHQSLSGDPSNTYPRMDEESRAYYRRETLRLAQIVKASELEFARRAIALCQETENELERHVGYYLLDQGQEALLGQMLPRSLRLGARLFVKRHALGLYRWLHWLVFLCLLAISIPLGLSAWIALPFAVMAFLMIEQFFKAALNRLCPPKLVPRMALDRLSRTQRTLVVCPTLLTSREQALGMIKQLSILQKANPDPRLHFMLLGDYADSLTASAQTDEEIVDTAAQAVASLQKDSGRPFFYMQRARALSPDDHQFMSRERKRGGLETLMKLLCGQQTEDQFDYSSIMDSELKGQYRYLITLDSDTFLPPGSALRLIGAMEHPLQRRMILRGKKRGVSILQPRIQTAAHTVTTRVGRWLGGEGGTDPYHSLAPDLMQDLFGRGSFVGKGIIDPPAFLEDTKGKIVPRAVLSHDLLEGELAGCKLTTDIVLYDGQPAMLNGFLARLHRWTRGDWQLLPYAVRLLPKRLRAPRDAVDRLAKLKIRANLARSLYGACKLATLYYAIGVGNAWLFALALLGDELFYLWPPMGFGMRLMALPSHVYTQLDAIARTLYRVFFSRKKLLEWTTAAQVATQVQASLPVSLYISVGAGGLAALLALAPEGALGIAGIVIAAVWALFPFALPLMEQPTRRAQPMTEYMRGELMVLAKETRTFFEVTVDAVDNHLPPDNLQIDPEKGVAKRTSPTNIGLYLLSLLSAQRLGLLTTDVMAARIEKTVSTLEKLDTWQGLHYNWYDTRSLIPLEPYFISSVDCGNLAACLLCLAQGLRALLPELPDNRRLLSARLDELAERMALNRLYDASAELFHIGWDTREDRPTGGHYDLLASEARILSFVSIMLGQAPVRHWSRLGRAMTKTRHGKTLVSYSGTMFEYLMPGLLMPQIERTLLETACQRAIQVQRGFRLSGAWGVSESGYYAFDPSLSYQYKAFGIPALALDPTQSCQVIAPYASMLALPYQSKLAFRNLQRMRQLGWEGPMGLFEAADFQKERTDESKGAKIVRSHMAHHQGMILCSICNALCDQHLIKLFFGLPKAQAHALLLEERFPKRATVILNPLKRQESIRPLRPYRFTRSADPLFFPVDAHLLGGGKTTLIIDAQGGGCMRHNGIMLTRFREECTIPSGMRFYLRDCETGGYVMATDPTLQGATRFESAQAIFIRQFAQLESTARYFINPIDGAALTQFTIKNQSQTDRMIELCSYLELAMTPLRDDLAHPAFHNLFIQTQRVGRLSVMAIKRSRDQDEPPLRLVHSLGMSQPPTSLNMTTDRTLFIGRNHTVYTPQSLSIPIGQLSDTLGNVIEPCLSLRAQWVIPALGETTLLFSSVVPDAKENPLEAAQRYAHPSSADKALGLALTQSLVNSRYWGLDQAQLRVLSRMVGCLVYTGQPHQQAILSPSAPLSELWSMGISGDLPILILRVRPEDETGTARLLGKAHALYRVSGLWIDLVYLMEGGSEALKEKLRQIARSACGDELIGKAGGIHLIDLSVLSDTKIGLITRVARLNLISGEPIADQLSHLVLGVSHPKLNAAPIPCADTPIQPEKLYMENGYGGFDSTGDYVINLAPEQNTPAPWSNLLATPHMGAIATESGVAMTYHGNSHQGRLTRWPCDSVSLYSGENFFLLDDARQLCWSATRWPLGEEISYTVTHRAGSTLYESLPYGLSVKLTAFTDGTLPLSLRTLTLKNRSEETRMLRYCHVVDFALGVGSQVALSRTLAGGDMIYAANPSLAGVGCLAAISYQPKQALCMSGGAFYGLFGRMPVALCPGNRLLKSAGSLAVLEYELTLKPNESAVISTALANASNKHALDEAVYTARKDGSSMRLHLMRLDWEKRLSVLRFSLSDKGLELMLNRYLPYQVYASRLFARAGFYQAGGAYGFRDQLQDLLAVFWSEPKLARAHILTAAEHQFEKGDVQHWWHPERLGVRTRISDDRLFLPYITAMYVAFTGDVSILSEQIAYLAQPELIQGEKESVQAPELTSYTQTLREQGLRAIECTRYGSHGLALMEDGDWNDGMNRVGGEHGESVWLSLFLAETLRVFAPLCDAAQAKMLLDRRAKLLSALEDRAWDGAWYLRAWYNDGTPLGTASATECRIDALPQSWAVIAGLRRERCELAMESLWRLLYVPEFQLLKLFTPPFDQGADPGYIAGYIPGVRENGGQYTHAAPWAITALKRLGHDKRAWALAMSLLPMNHTLTKEQADRYRVEPYVMAGDVYTAKGQEGRGGWTWYTGSAALLYHTIVTQLLGVTKIGNTLRLDPVLPPDIDDFSLTYQYQGSTYHLHALREQTIPMLDGQPLHDGIIKLRGDGRIHEALFPASLADGPEP